jgi:SAM-dependent methyltransferase
VTNEWDAAAGVYEDQFEVVTSTTVGRLLDWIAPAPGMVVADAACGPGTVSVQLAASGASVRASDFSEGMVSRARQRAAELSFDALIEVEVADAASLPLDDDAVDGAVSNFGVIFCPEIDAALHELARVTHADGRLAITAWTSEKTNGWTTLLAADYADELGFAVPVRPMYRWAEEGDFRAALDRAGWRAVEIETIDFAPKLLDPEDMGEALTTPATRIAIASLTDAQVEALAAYLCRRGREVYGGAPVPLPRQAWLARGVA